MLCGALKPFGLWNSGNGAQGQVLAQVYRYDQLNRLKQARGVEGLTTNNRWQTVTDAQANRYRSTYTYDANGNITAAERWDRDGNQYDDFSYKYEQRGGRLERNRLYQLNDLADAGNLYVNEPNGAKDIAYTGDVPFAPEATNINGAYNYRYDQLGNLAKDVREGIDTILWTVAGKVKQVEKTDGTVLTFAYGADGHRLWKEVTPPVLDDTGYREYYIRDAQGNIMATYRSQLITVPSPEPQGYAASLRVTERPVYGSSRLGTYARWEELYDHPVVSSPAPDPVQPVDLNYELTDHLGNVTAVVTGRLLNGNGGGTPKQAELVSAQGYEAFGSLLPGRNYSSDAYRFGFNGKENDNEVHGATGAFQDYGARAYDPRIARFFSVDPLAGNYPHYTPYSFAGNTPIWAIDLDGLEEFKMSTVDGQHHLHVTSVLGVITQGKNALMTDVSKLNAYLAERYKAAHQIRITKKQAQHLNLEFKKGEKRIVTVHFHVSAEDIGNGSSYVVDKNWNSQSAATVELANDDEVIEEGGTSAPGVMNAVFDIPNPRFGTKIMLNRKFFPQGVYQDGDTPNPALSDFLKRQGDDPTNASIFSVIAHENMHDVLGGHGDGGIMRFSDKDLYFDKRNARQLLNRNMWRFNKGSSDED